MRFPELGIEALSVGADDARPLLILHGFPDLPTSWQPLAERLAESGFRCVLPYMPGYPPSSVEGPFDADSLGDRIASLAAQLGDRVILVGHDWGSAVAQSAAMRYPERFSSLALMSVPHALSFLGNALRSKRQLVRSRYMAFFQLPFVPERRIRNAQEIAALYRRWSSGREPPWDHVEMVAATLAAAGGAPLSYYRQNLRPSWTLLRSFRAARGMPIRTPTLYLHGEDDSCIGPEIARGQERYFEGPFEAQLMPNAGHFLQLDAPAAVARAISEWLRRSES